MGFVLRFDVDGLAMPGLFYLKTGFRIHTVVRFPISWRASPKSSRQTICTQEAMTILLLPLEIIYVLFGSANDQGKQRIINSWG